MGKCNKPLIWSKTLGRCVDTRQKGKKKNKAVEKYKRAIRGLPEGDDPNKKR